MSKKEVTILSWHPTKSSVQYAGGFRRLYEILQRIPLNITVTYLDTKPSFLRQINRKNIKPIEYTIPNFIERAIQFHFILGKAIERLYVVFYLTKYLLSHKNTIVYVPFSELPQLTLPAVISKFFKKNKVIFCNLNPNTYFFDRIINQIVHLYSDLNITISNSLKVQLAELGIKCSVVNPVGIDINSYKKFGKKSKIKTGVFIGRHVEEKGIYTALRICAELNKNFNFTLNCIGDVPSDQRTKIKNLITDLNIENKVKLWGIVNEMTKIKLLSEATVCLFPSVQEGWGIVPQEAVLCGTPVVAYDLPVYQENIAKCPAVSLVKIGDIQEFSSKVQKWLFADRKEIDKQVKDSIKIIKKFDWGIIASKEWQIIYKT